MFPFLLLIIPFIQLGLTYYTSVASLAAITAVYFAKKSIFHGIMKRGYFMCVIFAGMLVSVLFSANAESSDYYRVCREALVFGLMFSMTRMSFEEDKLLNDTRVLFVLAGIMGVLCLMTIVQIGCLSQGMYCGIPQEFFVRNMNTLPGYLDLIYTKQRPAGTFGEPSYLSFICICMMVLISRLVRNSAIACIIFFSALFTAFLSQSFSGIVFSGIVFSIVYRHRLVLVSLVLGILFMLMLLYNWQDIHIFDRVINIVQGNDTSVNSRVFQPLSVVWEFLQRNPFGMPYWELVDSHLPYFGQIEIPKILQNGVFVLIFSYGIIGFAMIAAMFILLKGNVVLSVFYTFFLVQNGDPLGLDKLVMFILVFAGYNYFSYGLKSQSDQKQLSAKLSTS